METNRPSRQKKHAICRSNYATHPPLYPLLFVPISCTCIFFWLFRLSRKLLSTLTWLSPRDCHAICSILSFSKQCLFGHTCSELTALLPPFSLFNSPEKKKNNSLVRSIFLLASNQRGFRPFILSGIAGYLISRCTLT